MNFIIMTTALVFPALCVVASCSPVAVTRMGPTLPAKDPGCEVDILKEGEQPSRPWRDVAMLSVSNCQDYTLKPCLKWVADAACAVGGTVVYTPEASQGPSRDGRSDDLVGPVTFQLMVGVYAGLLPPGDDDPVMTAKELPCATSGDMSGSSADDDDPDFGVCKETP